MSEEPTLHGIHHLTAVTARARDNLAFYRDTLGMRLVKKTVNQDDVRAYHLFYADGVGSPGTDVTFFDWSMAAPERRGTHSIARTGLRVAGGAEALGWWASRLRAAGAAVEEPSDVDGRPTLAFEDPEGQRLALVDDGGAGEAHPWEASPVPAERQIRGLGPITLSVPDPRPTATVLVEVLGMELTRSYRRRRAATRCWSPPWGTAARARRSTWPYSPICRLRVPAPAASTTSLSGPPTTSGTGPGWSG